MQGLFSKFSEKCYIAVAMFLTTTVLAVSSAAAYGLTMLLIGGKSSQLAINLFQIQLQIKSFILISKPSGYILVYCIIFSFISRNLRYYIPWISSYIFIPLTQNKLNTTDPRPTHTHIKNRKLKIIIFAIFTFFV